MVYNILAVGALIVVTLSICTRDTRTNAQAVNEYCNETLCAPDQKHIACNDNKGMQEKCLLANDPEEYQIDQNLVQEILQLHNRLRSNIASGKVAGFDKASRMLKLKWDKSLATVAGFNARSCSYGHDQCRNTPLFKTVGQNIHSIYQAHKYVDTDEYIKSAIQGWFDEYKLCSMSTIQKYDGNHAVGHFTQIVRDACGHVGCAATRWHNVSNPEDGHTIYLVCNYDVTNYAGAAIYQSGKPCAECPPGSKCSRAYPGLCNAAHVAAAAARVSLLAAMAAALIELW